MSIIKTDLRTATTDDQGNLELLGNRAFSGVFNLGLILGSKDPYSQQFQTDENGLQEVKTSLDLMISECLSGLAGIGAIIGMVNPEELIKDDLIDDLINVGCVIRNLALLSIEAQDHSKSIGFDIRDRNGYLKNPEQANIHAELHKEALAVQELCGVDYETALVRAAQCLQAVKQTPRRAKK